MPFKKRLLPFRGDKIKDGSAYGLFFLKPGIVKSSLVCKEDAAFHVVHKDDVAACFGKEPVLLLRCPECLLCPLACGHIQKGRNYALRHIFFVHEGRLAYGDIPSFPPRVRVVRFIADLSA